MSDTIHDRADRIKRYMALKGVPLTLENFKVYLDRDNRIRGLRVLPGGLAARATQKEET